MEYNLEFFINKFNDIPEDKWTVGTFVDDRGCMCAYGHCGFTESSLKNSTEESRALKRLDDDTRTEENSIVLINDDLINARSFGPTPKQRVVNYLKSLRKCK